MMKSKIMVNMPAIKVHQLFAERTNIKFQERAAFIYEEKEKCWYFLENLKNFEKLIESQAATLAPYEAITANRRTFLTMVGSYRDKLAKVNVLAHRTLLLLEKILLRNDEEALNDVFGQQVINKEVNLYSFLYSVPKSLF